MFDSAFDALLNPSSRFLTPAEIIPVPRADRLGRCRSDINRAMRDAAYKEGKPYIVLHASAFPEDLKRELFAELEAYGWAVQPGIGVVRIDPRPK